MSLNRRYHPFTNFHVKYCECGLCFLKILSGLLQTSSTISYFLQPTVAAIEAGKDIALANKDEIACWSEECLGLRNG